MRTIIKLLAVFALMLGTFSQHTAASAEARQKYWNVSTFISSTDPSGCISTTVSVFAYEQVILGQPSPGSPDSAVHLLIKQFDTCGGRILLDAEAFSSLADSDLQISGNLASATLNTTVTAYDAVSNSYFDVLIDLMWTGTGSLLHYNGHFKDIWPGAGCKELEHSNEALRYAEASGTVSDGTTNFASGSSYDPYTYLFSNNYGEFLIGCH
jgi:hypothetical protein